MFEYCCDNQISDRDNLENVTLNLLFGYNT